MPPKITSKTLKASDRDAATWDRRRLVSQLYLKGLPQPEIAKRLACSQPTVSSDLRAMQVLWLEGAMKAFDERKSEEIARIDLVETEAWSAWERSKVEYMAHSTRTEKTMQYQPVPGARVDKTTGRVPKKLELVPSKVVKDRKLMRTIGDTKYLDVVAWCIEMRCKITGVFKEQASITTNVTVLNFDQLAEAVAAAGMGVDPLEQRILDVANTA